MGSLCFSVHIGAGQFGACFEKHTIAACSKLWMRTVTRDAYGVAASGCNAIDAGFRGCARADQIAAFALFKNDGFAVWSKTRGRIMARCASHRSAGSAGDGDGLDFAKAGVGPTDKNDALSIGRPCRIGFHRLYIVGQAFSRTARCRFDP